MTTPTQEAKNWHKPEVTRLGTLRDVAGKETPGSQSSNSKS